MPHDDYPFPIDDLLQVAATDVEATGYEETVVRLLNDWIGMQGGAIHGHSGVLLSATIDGPGPTSRLRLHDPSPMPAGNDAYWPVWDDQGVAVPRMAAGRPNLESPSSLGGLVRSNWADGSIHAHDDPYWAAVERQQQAIAGWRAAYPKASAAVPGWQRDATVEQQRAAWAEWAQCFPQAAAGRREVFRPVKDFLDEPPAPRS